MAWKQIKMFCFVFVFFTARLSVSFFILDIVLWADLRAFVSSPMCISPSITESDLHAFKRTLEPSTFALKFQKGTRLV